MIGFLLLSEPIYNHDLKSWDAHHRSGGPFPMRENNINKLVLPQAGALWVKPDNSYRDFLLNTPDGWGFPIESKMLGHLGRGSLPGHGLLSHQGSPLSLRSILARRPNK